MPSQRVGFVVMRERAIVNAGAKVTDGPAAITYVPDGWWLGKGDRFGDLADAEVFETAEHAWAGLALDRLSGDFNVMPVTVAVQRQRVTRSP